VIAEGEENVLKEFIREINIKNEIANVESISSGFSGATGEFTGFKKLVKEDEIGDRLDTAVEYLKVLIKTVKGGDAQIIETVKGGNKELGEKIVGELGEKIERGNKELGEKIVGELGEKIERSNKELGEKIVGELGEKIESGNQYLVKELGGRIDGLGGKMDSFHHDMSQRFDLLDVKYGITVEVLGKAVEGMEKTDKNIEKIIERMEKQQENQNQIIEKLINVMIENKK
jgi:hypothetical protein